LEQHFDKPLDNFFKIYYEGKNLPKYRIRYWKIDDTVFIHTQFISNQIPDVFCAMPLDFTLLNWQNGAAKDSNFVVMNTAPSQDYKIVFAHNHWQLLFDMQTKILARLDFLESPEAIYNYNLPLQLTPNPAHDAVFFNEKKYNISQLNFYDVTGKLHETVSVQHNVINRFGDLQQIDVSHLNRGFYFVEIITSNNLVYYQKLILQ
jgi:hypothetical protein